MFRLWNSVLQRTKGLTHFNSAKQTLNLWSTTIPNMSNFWKPGQKIIFKKKPSKLKHDQKVQGSTLNHEEGTKILRNLGRTVVAATTGDYLVNLDLWAIILWVTDYLTTNASIEFFQLSGFVKWQKCVPLFIDDSPIWETGHQDFQV